MAVQRRLVCRASFVLLTTAIIILPSCKDHDSHRDTYTPPDPVVYTSPSTPTVIPSYVPASRPQPVSTPTSTPEIRVAVLKDVPSIRISAPTSGARIVLNGQPWRKLASGMAVNVTYSGPAILIEGQPTGANSVRFESLISDEVLHLNDRDSAANVTVSHPGNRPGLLAVAQLNIEEYLAGVLAGEVPYDRWHAEALKAQAVVSRSYALSEMRGRTTDSYDVECTVMSQVFRSGFKNVPSLYAAIQSTRGLALTSNGAIFPAYFHSTCGGHTEAAAGIFPEFSALKPLCGVNCPHCTQSPSYRWKASFSKDMMVTKLKSQFPNLGKIETIAFVDNKGVPVGASPNDMRRVQSVSIKHSNGVSQMQGNAFRLAVGPKELKSLLFGQVVDNGAALEITGGGFGHGVGLCQYGMEGMAASGQPYINILGTYFPGAALTRIY